MSNLALITVLLITLIKVITAMVTTLKLTLNLVMQVNTAKLSLTFGTAGTTLVTIQATLFR